MSKEIETLTKKEEFEKLIKELETRVIEDNSVIETERFTFFSLEGSTYRFRCHEPVSEDSGHDCRIGFYPQTMELRGNLRTPHGEKVYLIWKDPGLKYDNEPYWRGNGIREEEHVFIGTEESANMHCKELARADRVTSIKEELRADIMKSIFGIRYGKWQII